VITVKKFLVFVLVFILALCPVYVMSSVAAGDFVVEDGVLLSFTGLTTTVTVPDDVYYIADGAFKDNVRINKLNLHDGVTAVGNEAFYGCTSLKEVNGGESVDYVGAYAFYGTPYFDNAASEFATLGSVVLGGTTASALEIPENITMIAPYAFAENTVIESLITYDSLSVIGEGAFYRCNNLSTVNVSSNLSYIGSLAFSGTKFVADSEDEFVVLGDGCLVGYKGSDSSVTVPESVKYITGGAFYSNTHITEVNVPDGVASIGERAFMNCTKLAEVSLPESLIMIDKEAFARCKALNTITVPASVQLMGESVFFGCNSLENAKLLCDLDIPRGIFANCTSLTYATISQKTTEIGDSAFLNCTSLTDLSVSDTVKNIAPSAFQGAEILTVSCNKASFAFEFCSENGINVQQCGDANLDGKVNIRDATYIQKHVASIVTMNEIEALRAEVNFDGKINVRDATYIQKLLAGLI